MSECKCKRELREQAIEDLDSMFQAAYSAICHCANNPAGVFPESCGCDGTKRTNDSIRMLLRVKAELQKKYYI